MRHVEFRLEIEDYGGSCEVAITIGSHVIGYVGGSRYEDRVIDAAEEAIAAALAPLLLAQPGVSASSRFADPGD